MMQNYSIPVYVFAYINHKHSSTSFVYVNRHMGTEIS